MATISTSVDNNLSTDSVRRETRDGREWLVAPIILMREMVYEYPKEGTSEFLPSEHISLSAGAWADTALTVGHPESSARKSDEYTGSVLGRAFEPEALNGGEKLREEVWIDVEKANSIGGQAAQIVDALENGETLSVSAGYSTNPGVLSDEPGVYNGVEYDTVQGVPVPDHIALYPPNSRAMARCTPADGCALPRENAFEPEPDATDEPGGESDQNPLAEIMSETDQTTDGPDGSLPRDKETRESIIAAMSETLRRTFGGSSAETRRTNAQPEDGGDGDGDGDADGESEESDDSDDDDPDGDGDGDGDGGESDSDGELTPESADEDSSEGGDEEEAESESDSDADADEDADEQEQDSDERADTRERQPSDDDTDTDMDDSDKIDVLVEEHGLDRENMVPLEGTDCLGDIYSRFESAEAPEDGPKPADDPQDEDRPEDDPAEDDDPADDEETQTTVDPQTTDSPETPEGVDTEKVSEIVQNAVEEAVEPLEDRLEQVENRPEREQRREKARVVQNALDVPVEQSMEMDEEAFSPLYEQARKQAGSPSASPSATPSANMGGVQTGVDRVNADEPDDDELDALGRGEAGHKARNGGD